MSELDDLNEQIAVLAGKRNKIEDEHRKKQLRPLIGTYWKFWNSYGGSKPSDYWWMYRKITGIKGRYATSFDFQTDKDGKIIIESRDYVVDLDHWKKCDEKEFMQAWKALQKKVKGFKV